MAKKKKKFKALPPTKEENSTVIQIKVILNMPFCNKASQALLAGWVWLPLHRNERQCKGFVWISQAPTILVPLYCFQWVYSEFTSPWGTRIRPLVALFPRNTKSGDQNLFFVARMQTRRNFAARAISCMVALMWLWPRSGICCDVFVVHICWIWDAFEYFPTQLAESSVQKLREILNLQPNVSLPARILVACCNCSSFWLCLLQYFLWRAVQPLPKPSQPATTAYLKLNHQVPSASVQLPACLEVHSCS